MIQLRNKLIASETHACAANYVLKRKSVFSRALVLRNDVDHPGISKAARRNLACKPPGLKSVGKQSLSSTVLRFSYSNDCPSVGFSPSEFLQMMPGGSGTHIFWSSMTSEFRQERVLFLLGWGFWQLTHYCPWP